jgi:hypothetical protein
MRFDRQRNVRHMFVAAGATNYPTGKVLGTQGAGGATLVVASDTRSATAGDSVMLVDGIEGARILSVLWLDAAGATGALTFQDHAGTTLGIVIAANRQSRIDFQDGMEIRGSWRISASTVGVCVVTYELLGEPRSVLK